MRKYSYKAGVIFTLVGGVMWGFSGACGQYLFTQKGVTADWLVPYRLLLSGLIMLFFFFIKQKTKAFRIFKNPKDTLWLLGYAFIGLTICQYTYFYGVELSNAAVATVIQYSAPAFIVVIVALKNHRAPKKIEIAALLCASGGVFLIATHGNPYEMVVSQKALIVCMICAISAIFYNLLPTKINQKYSVSYCLAWALFIGGVFMCLFMRVWELKGVGDFGGFCALFGIIIFGTIGAFSFYMTGVSIIGAPRASVLACCEPVAAASFAYFWLDTNLVWIDFIGFGLILGCTFLLRKN